MTTTASVLFCLERRFVWGTPAPGPQCSGVTARAPLGTVTASGLRGHWSTKLGSCGPGGAGQGSHRGVWSSRASASRHPTAGRRLHGRARDGLKHTGPSALARLCPHCLAVASVGLRGWQRCSSLFLGHSEWPLESLCLCPAPPIGVLA